MAARPTPTLTDVALRAGVSTATVSRCLNEPDKVIPATRDRVNEAVQALGYSPNFGARVMAARRTKTIGAIIPTMENAIFARGLQAFQVELGTDGYMLLVASSNYDRATEEAQIRALVARGADALMLIGTDRSDAIYDFLDAQQVPVLTAWTSDATRGHASVGFNNRTAMRDLAAEVLSLGHRKLGLILAPTQANDRARNRLAGVHDAMGAAGLDPASLQIQERNYSIAQGADGCAALLASPTPPTAILCGNDVLAVGALQRARDLGIDVPGTLSITGFDDIELASVAVPALTTVHVPDAEMGRRAARQLIDMVNGAAPQPPVELPTDLRRRQSLAKVPT